MKKVFFMIMVAIVATSCGVGTYYPNAQNRFGAQTTVVLDKANFRVVRDVEAIVRVNMTNLSRADVENSDYGELLRNAQLTGSQVLINVVIEEVRRASGGILKVVQYVAARATIIEFLNEEGMPIKSEPYVASNRTFTTQKRYSRDSLETARVDIVESSIETPGVVENKATTPVVKENVKPIGDESVELKSRHQQLVQLYNNSQSFDDGNVFNIYYNLYKSIPRTTEDIEMLLKIQQVVMQYYSSKTTSYPDLEKQLKAVSSLSEQKNILISYLNRIECLSQ